MNTFKRFFALILTLCMVLSYVPVGAQAAETGPVSLSGTPTTPAGVSGVTEPFPTSVFDVESVNPDTSNTGHFRIPVIVTLNNGTMVAAADVRWHAWDSTDDNGNIDTIVSYSTDNGASWTYNFANYYGGSNNAEVNYGAPTYIDPGLGTDGSKLYMIVDLYPGQSGQSNCTLYSSTNIGYDAQGRLLLRANGTTSDTGYYLDKYDDGTGKTYYKIYTTTAGVEQDQYIVDGYFNLYEKNDQGTYVHTRNLFEYSTTSFMPVMTSHLYLTTSEDGGQTWSEPTMINPSVRPGKGENCYLVNPGRGIYTKDGVLVFSGYCWSGGNATAYANLMFTADGGKTWTTTEFSGDNATENEMVELRDGTLRMFVRSAGTSGSELKYIDWTPQYDSDRNVTGYEAGALKSVSGITYNNDCNLSAISYSGTYQGYQVILVSCPTNGRANGKVFAFYVDDNQNMVKIGEKAISSNAYSYSSLIEQADGKIALLYENGDAGNIHYLNLDISDILSQDVTLDEDTNIFVDGIDNSASVSVQVTVSSNVTHIHTQQNTNVSGITGTYTAYDVVLCTDAEESCTDGLGCANTYTNAATVTIPISAETAGKHLKGFVVNDNGTLTYVEKVEVRRYPNGNYTVSFKAPHFSTVGVKVLTDEEIATDRKTIDIVVGQTHTEYLNEEEYTGSKNDTAANVAWGVVDHVVTFPSAKLGTDANFGGDTIDLNDCLYTFTKNADGTWLISAEVNGNKVYVDPYVSGKGGYPNRSYETNVTITDSTETDDKAVNFSALDTESSTGVGYLHFWDNDANKVHWDNCTRDGCTGHDLLLYRAVANGEESSDEIPGFVCLNGTADLSENVGQYLIVGKNTNATRSGYYVMHPANNISDRYAHVAKVTGTTAQKTVKSTEVTFQGLAVGQTTVLVGTTLYTVNVQESENVKHVEVQVGKTVTITDDTGNYENEVDRNNLDTSIANVTVSGTAASTAYTTATNAATQLKAGGTYLICLDGTERALSNSGTEHKSGIPCLNTVDNDKTATDAVLWTLVEVDAANNKFYLKNGDKYLNFGTGTDRATLTDNPEAITFTWDAGTSAWYFGNDNGIYANNLGGANKIGGWTGNGTKFDIYEVTAEIDPGTTTIQITGVAKGDTSVVIGDTTYNVHVSYAPETIPVQMYVGESRDFIVEGGIYDSATNSDETVASVTLTPDAVTDDNRLRQVTELRSGAKYLIETNIGTKVLLNGTDQDTGLLLSGEKSADSTQVWTIEEYDNGHSVSIMVNGVRKYLTMTGNDSATLVDSPVALQVKYNGTNWTIAQGNCYLNRFGGQTSNKAAGWNGAGASTGAGSMWNIYEVVNQNRTYVTINGNKAGNTTIVVGHVTYEVEVINEVVNVEMFVGETQHFSADRVKFGNAKVTVNDPSVALVTVQAKPVEITAEANLVVGKQYVFMNNSANKALTNVASGNTLVLNGTTDNLGRSMIWTLTAFDPNTGVAKLQDANGKYLNFGAATASVGGDFEFILNREDGGYWTIRTNTTEDVYLNNAGRRGVADGYRNGRPTEDICQWSVYEVDTAAADAGTAVTITGLKPGETVATVGHVTYNITVKEIVKNVEIFVGETWTDSINGISENGTYNNDHVSATWKDIGIREGVGQLLNANGEITSSIELSEAELTFTLSNGKYKIATAGGKFLDISGYPFDDSFEEANDYVSLSFGADGAVRLVNLEGHYLQVYTGSGAPEWAWKTAHTGNITDDAFAFYIYEAVENARDSSAEIPGYRKITSADEITSGESYLVAFVKDGTYYVAHYTGTSGKNANMARISTTQTGAFTDVSIVGNHVGEATVKFNGVTYNVTVKPFEKNFSLEIDETESFKAHECVTQAMVDEFNAKHGKYVTAKLEDGKLVFTGIAESNESTSVKEYLLGDTLYTITVTPVLAHPNDTKYVGGQRDTQGEGQKITGLIISNDTIYDLNLDSSMDGKDITWRSSDETLFTVDQNGTVTTKGKGGDGYITIYDGDKPYQIIPIHVIETNKTGNLRVVDIYNTEVINCTAYYTLNEGEIHEFPKGYQIFVNHTTSETELITFYATPDEGHALTYINAVDGTWFHPVVNKEGTDYLVDGEHDDTLTMNGKGYKSLHDQLIAYVANNSGAADADTIHAMLDSAVALQIDGAFFFSRATGTNNIQTSTTFVAEKLPTVDKSVNGILGTSGLQVDFKSYSDGMYAEVGQHVYFNVTVEVTAPLFWDRAVKANDAGAMVPYTPAANYAGVVVDTSGFVVTKNADGVWVRALDAEGNPYAPAEGADVLMVDSQGYVLKVDTNNGRPIPALRYTASNLFDNLKGAYFYTKKLDRDDGKYEGFLEPSLQKTAQDITAELNRTWTAEELAAGRRVLEYFVVYQIQPSDLNQDITNTVDLEYVYTTVYSDGSGESDSHADASLVVLGQSLGDVVIDFGLPFVKTGLTVNELPGIEREIKNADGVVVGYEYDASLVEAFNVNSNAAQGGCKFGTVEITYDAKSDTYNLIYTPKAILTTYDVIYIMDANNKLVNYIRVRPASTVFYEESFAELGSAKANATTNGWSAVMPITGTQEYEDVGCVKHDHDNFGYDEKYAGETGMSNGTELISTYADDTATFTFNGTGFDIYANCDPASSVVAVLVYRMRSTIDAEGNAIQSAELTKFYQVLTHTKNGETDATTGQGINADSSAIVSVTGLEHGTYKVVIRHTKRSDDTTTAFALDGFRIYNTLKDGDQYYPINEKRVVFTELRDEVLFAAGVTADSTQTYNRDSDYVSTTAPGATVAFLRDSENAVLEENVQDWLNNGPKNEIWMKSNDALVFTLYAGDPDTQAGAIANAQLGMKAPTGKAVVLITLSNGRTWVASKEYTITSATDMFYELPETDSGMINGLTVTVTVEEGMVSITKLKANVYEGGVATVSPLSMMDDLDIASALNVLYPTNDDNGETTDPSDPDDGTTTDPSDPDDGTTTDPSDPDDGTTTDPSDPDDGETTDPSDPSDDDLPDAGVDVYKDTVNRIFGENRFETAFKVADELKAVLGIEKFKNIIIASGTNFADALSGTYLASVKNAPILLSYNEVYNDMVREYIAENLAEDGTVYILGGNAAVPYTMDLELIADGITIKRLAGADRFATNLAILTEAGVKGGEILVCTGSNFADSLSASATGKPILLVYNESGELSVAQKLYLTMMDRANFTIIGGEKAISAELEEAVSAYGVTNRLAGANRFETSVAIAEAYFTDPQDLVLAYAGNYPDGLCGGALAYAINAPLVLTMSGYETEADAYADAFDVQGGVVLGGSGLISDDSVVEIFGLEKPEEIIVK